MHYCSSHRASWRLRYGRPGIRSVISDDAKDIVKQDAANRLKKKGVFYVYFLSEFPAVLELSILMAIFRVEMG